MCKLVNKKHLTFAEIMLLMEMLLPKTDFNFRIYVNILLWLMCVEMKIAKWIFGERADQYADFYFNRILKAEKKIQQLAYGSLHTHTHRAH